MPRGIFPSPLHRCCVYNVQRLHQENSTGHGGEVGLLQPRHADRLTVISGMLLIKEFLRKSTVSSSAGGEQSKGLVVAGGGLRANIR